MLMLPHLRYTTRMRCLSLLLLFLVGMFLRLVVIANTGISSDVANFAETARIAAAGRNIYVEQYYYNYTPLVAYLVAWVDSLPFSFDVTWGLLLGIGDFVAALLLAGLAPKGKRGIVCLIYWLNPAVVYLSAFWGNYDLLALIPLLALALLMRRSGWLAHLRSSSSTS